ncbi:MAG: ATP-binding cassette domain-containing protein, partial [Leptodesmis sp.]|uniref:ATP-binding cassette domain-containing protein n=1 Tax=Leptodesmis sp. TaxID=3100501 RepID=UPI003D0977C3
ATAGTVRVLGKRARDARLGIGYLTQQFSLYLDLSVNENLSYSAGLREVPEALFQQRRLKYLKLMSLEDMGDRLAAQLSGGMKQKLALCCALVAQPHVLLLDEPTTGVDPVSRREFWDVLATLADEGTTIVVATPYLDEAERCNRIALMYEGQIQQLGTVKQLRDSLGLQRLELYTPTMSILERIQQVLTEASLESSISQIADVQSFGDRLDVLVKDPQLGKAEVRSLLDRHHLPLHSIQVAEPTLENVFVTRLRQQGSEPPFVHFPREKPAIGDQGSAIRDQGLGIGDWRSEEIQNSTFNIQHSWDDREIQNPKSKIQNSPTPHTPHPTPSIAIGAQGLTKVFGDFQAVHDVTLEVRYGEIYGLLGANGAGKTTTIKMLCGLSEATSGTMLLAGQTNNLRSNELRQRIGYMSQKFTLYDDLSVVENLEFYCGVYGVPRRSRRTKIDWVLETCGLVGRETMLTGKLPGGWKQRVAFGASVMHEPEILFLDEPTSGVDPLARRQFWRLIEDFAHQGTAILVTTHYLEEAEHCNRLGLMVAGEVVAQGSPSQIKAEQSGQLIEVICDRTQAASNLLKTQVDPWRVSIFGDRLHLVLDRPNSEIPTLRDTLQNHQITVHSLCSIPFSLEDAFIGIVQRVGKGKF